MFLDINKYSNWVDATIEILIILIVTFSLWFLLSWLIFSKRQLYTNNLAKEKNKSIKKNKEKKVFIRDNLRIIQWLSWKMEKILNKNNIFKFKELSEISIKGLLEILEESWKKEKALYFKTWPDQSRLAFNKKWWELKEYQELLLSSKKSK